MTAGREAEYAAVLAEHVCRTCLAPIWWELGEVGHREREGWSDRIKRGGDSLVCFKAIAYRHVPLTDRERAYYEAGAAAVLAALPAALAERFDEELAVHAPHIVGSGTSWSAECLANDWAESVEGTLYQAVGAHRRHVAAVLAALPDTQVTRDAAALREAAIDILSHGDYPSAHARWFSTWLDDRATAIESQTPAGGHAGRGSARAAAPEREAATAPPAGPDRIDKPGGRP